MKRYRYIIMLACLILGISSASAQDAVYFGNVSKDVSVGIGAPKDIRQDITLSVMQINKSKKFDEFTLEFLNMDGEPMSFNVKRDTVYHIVMDGLYYHQQDYKLSRMEYVRLCRTLNDSQSVIRINGVEYNGAAFVGIVRTLETEQLNFSEGRNDLKRVTMMGVPRFDMQFMRFQNPNRRNDFRFVRFRGFQPPVQQQTK